MNKLIIKHCIKLYNSYILDVDILSPYINNIYMMLYNHDMFMINLFNISSINIYDPYLIDQFDREIIYEYNDHRITIECRFNTIYIENTIYDNKIEEYKKIIDHINTF